MDRRGRLRLRRAVLLRLRRLAARAAPLRRAPRADHHHRPRRVDRRNRPRRGARWSTAGVVAAACLGMVVAAAFWWLYFDVVALVASRHLAELPPGREQNEVARDSYSYLHFWMVAGIVLAALGLKTTIAHVGDALALVPAVALLGGVAMYLLAPHRVPPAERRDAEPAAAGDGGGRPRPDPGRHAPAGAGHARRSRGGAGRADRVRDAALRRGARPRPPRLDDGDRDPLDAVVGVAADVPCSVVGLDVPGLVAGAAGEDVLARRRVPFGVPAAPGPAAAARARAQPRPRSPRRRWRSRRPRSGAHPDQARPSIVVGPASTVRVALGKPGNPGGNHQRARERSESTASRGRPRPAGSGTPGPAETR